MVDSSGILPLRPRYCQHAPGQGFDTFDTAAVSKQVPQEEICDADAGPVEDLRSLLLSVVSRM